MTESEYVALADALFAALEQDLEAAEVDYELAPGGILEIECDDGSKIVINRQAAMREIWVAARSGGFHFRWQDGAWLDSRGGGELSVALAAILARQCGREVGLRVAGAA